MKCKLGYDTLSFDWLVIHHVTLWAPTQAWNIHAPANPFCYYLGQHLNSVQRHESLSYLFGQSKNFLSCKPFKRELFLFSVGLLSNTSVCLLIALTLCLSFIRDRDLIVSGTLWTSNQNIKMHRRVITFLGPVSPR